LARKLFYLLRVDMVLYLTAMILGEMLGVAVNYLADVLPATHRLATPRCSNCNTSFSAKVYMLGQRCPICNQERPLRFWVLEVCLSIAGVVLVSFPITKLGTWTSLLLLAYLVMIVVIDIENRLILHLTSLIGAILALWIGWHLHGFYSTIFGGIAGFGIMLGMYLLGIAFLRLSRKMHNQQITESDAIGFGDVNFSGIVGLLLGWPGVIGGLVLAILLAGVASLIYLLYKAARHEYNPNLALPYGPFLAFSVIILLYIRPFIFK
jgi:prepilin signal peptidase PulO-like enzyme (type II secretory pathway)